VVLVASHTVGSYSFLIGFLVAVVFGLVAGIDKALLAGLDGIVLLVLMVFGLVVGLLNIKEEHMAEFLVSCIAIAMIGSIAVQNSIVLIPQIGPVISMMFQNIVAFTAPAGLIIGIRYVWVIGYTKSKN
jgi:hypothetical protein